jgi:hypothetical protein
MTSKSDGGRVDQRPEKRGSPLSSKMSFNCTQLISLLLFFPRSLIVTSYDAKDEYTVQGCMILYILKKDIPVLAYSMYRCEP